MRSLAKKLKVWRLPATSTSTVIVLDATAAWLDRSSCHAALARCRLLVIVAITADPEGPNRLGGIGPPGAQLRCYPVNTILTFTLGVLGFLATGASAIAAIGSCKSSRQASQAATTLAGIERDRWHTELSPIFEIACHRSPVSERATLVLTLTGPPGLDRLDGVAVAVRDDQPRKPTGIGPPADEISKVIWGPCRFVPSVDQADKLGRAVPSLPLDKMVRTPLALEPSLVPHWHDHSTWRRQYADHPLRLTITGTREGHKPWMIPRDVPIEPEPGP